MRRPIHLILPFLLVFTFFFSFNARAGHASLMELEYRHVSGSTYEFTLTFYRNCLGGSASAPPSMRIGMKSDSLSINNSSFATLLAIPLTGAPPLQNLHNCATGPLCYEEYVYRGQANVPHITHDLIFYSELCCYPTEIDNVPSTSIYTECGLNTLDFPHGNDAPHWHTRAPNRTGHTSLSDIVINYPVKSVCANKEVTIAQNVVEYQGDQVHYEFIEPLGSGGAPAGYTAGYTFANPFPFYTPPGLDIDTNTGVFQLKADSMATPKPGVDMYVVGIKATEYRTVAGVKKQIGFVVRHFTIIVEPEATCPGSDIALQDSAITGQCGDTSISVAITKKFICESADSDASFIELTDSTTGSPIAVKDVTVDNCWHGLVSTDFEVNLTSPLTPGTYYLTLIDGGDGNTIESECGFFIAARQDTLIIRVDDVPEAQLQPSNDTSGNPLTYIAAECGQEEVTITLDAPVWCSSLDTSASEWAVVDSSGPMPVLIPVQKVSYACVDEQTSEFTLHFAQPLEPGTYWINLQNGTDGNTLLNACDKATPATAMQLVVNDVSVVLGPDLEYCKNTIFFAFLDAGPGLSYAWNTGDTTQQLLITTKGVYKVEVFNEYGCSATDSVVVTEKDCWVGVEENEQARFAVYPNPSKGALYLQGNSNLGQVTVNLRDLSGKSVMETTTLLEANKPVLLQLEALPKGLYFVELRTSDYNGVKKVMLQ